MAAAATGEDDAESRLELLERRTRFTPKPDGVPLVARDREGKLPAPKLPPWSERLAGKTAAEAAWEFWIGEARSFSLSLCSAC